MTSVGRTNHPTSPPSDSKTKGRDKVAPVRITRSVGLQVCLKIHLCCFWINLYFPSSVLIKSPWNSLLTVQPTQVMTPDQRRLQQQRASANRLGRPPGAPSTASTPSGLTVSPAAARAPPSVGGLVPGSVTITPTKVRFTSQEGEFSSMISRD